MAINTTYGLNLVTSMSKAYKNATKTGKLALGKIALYDLIAYYIEFTRGKAEYNEEHAFLIDKILTLQYDNPDIICNYKSSAPTGTTLVPPASNTAPTVSDNAIDLAGNTQHRFTVGNLTLNYADAQSHPYKYVVINPLSAGINGILSTDAAGTNLVTTPYILNIEGLASTYELNLYYTRTNSASFALNDYFNIRVSDNPEDYLYSAIVKIDVWASLADGTENQPATIGDNTIYVANRVETVFTLANFTTGLTPPYNDPEADLIDAIRIDEISDANVGKFYLNGVEIQVLDIITREDLNAGLFKHVAPDQDAINSDVFYFSARDEGSQIWVQ